MCDILLMVFGFLCICHHLFFGQGNTIDVRSKDPLDLGVAAVNMKTGQPVFSLDVQVS